MAELKPCPFCGGKDIRKLTTVFDCNIFCGNCGASIFRSNFRTGKSLADTLADAEPQAIEAWNRRYTPSKIDFDYGAED